MEWASDGGRGRNGHQMGRGKGHLEWASNGEEEGSFGMGIKWGRRKGNLEWATNEGGGRVIWNGHQMGEGEGSFGMEIVVYSYLVGWLLDSLAADLLHVVPVVESATADGKRHAKGVSHAHGFIPNIVVLQVCFPLTRSAQHCGKYCPWVIRVCKASRAHSGAIIDDHHLNIRVTKSLGQGGRRERERDKLLLKVVLDQFLLRWEAAGQIMRLHLHEGREDSYERQPLL